MAANDADSSRRSDVKSFSHELLFVSHASSTRLWLRSILGDSPTTDQIMTQSRLEEGIPVEIYNHTTGAPLFGVIPFKDSGIDESRSIPQTKHIVVNHDLAPLCQNDSTRVTLCGAQCGLAERDAQLLQLARRSHTIVFCVDASAAVNVEDELCDRVDLEMTFGKNVIFVLTCARPENAEETLFALKQSVLGFFGKNVFTLNANLEDGEEANMVLKRIMDSIKARQNSELNQITVPPATLRIGFDETAFMADISAKWTGDIVRLASLHTLLFLSTHYYSYFTLPKRLEENVVQDAATVLYTYFERVAASMLTQHLTNRLVRRSEQQVRLQWQLPDDAPLPFCLPSKEFGPAITRALSSSTDTSASVLTDETTTSLPMRLVQNIGRRLWNTMLTSVDYWWGASQFQIGMPSDAHPLVAPAMRAVVEKLLRFPQSMLLQCAKEQFQLVNDAMSEVAKRSSSED